MDYHATKFVGIGYSTWCVIANSIYLAILITAACTAVNLDWKLTWWQNLIAVVVFFLPLGWFVDHHSYGTLLIEWFFRWKRRAD